MEIRLENLGKKFNRDWIFRQVQLTLHPNEAYTITGPNGSGKSTLLQQIAGIMPQTEGAITYTLAGKTIHSDDWFRYIAIAAPYLELIEEFTLAELVQFHQQFKPFRDKLSVIQFIDRIGLEKARHKPVKYFSSGMKTRVKLGLACYSDVPVLMLDEPTSNLDANGIAWYQETLQATMANRLLILCSNQPYEYSFCKHILRIQDSRLVNVMA
jgi:ABC-type multidrug transport system ATPase subunit